MNISDQQALRKIFTAEAINPSVKLLSVLCADTDCKMFESLHCLDKFIGPKPCYNFFCAVFILSCIRSLSQLYFEVSCLSAA
jgi:hypothetical protein